MYGAAVDDRGGAPAAAQPTGQPWSNRVPAASKPACVRWMHPARRRVWLERHRSSLVARDAQPLAQPAVPFVGGCSSFGLLFGGILRRTRLSSDTPEYERYQRRHAARGLLFYPLDSTP